MPVTTAYDTRGVVDFVRGNTAPGAPLFVYPAAPLLNFLAERPNPTRFEHFLPGTLTQSGFELAIAELEQARPRYVIWDHRGVVVWGTDPANRPLSDYLWTCYQQVAAFNLYLVLERRTDLSTPCGMPARSEPTRPLLTAATRLRSENFLFLGAVTRIEPRSGGEALCRANTSCH